MRAPSAAPPRSTSAAAAPAPARPCPGLPGLGRRPPGCRGRAEGTGTGTARALPRSPPLPGVPALWFWQAALRTRSLSQLVRAPQAVLFWKNRVFCAFLAFGNAVLGAARSLLAARRGCCSPAQASELGCSSYASSSPAVFCPG